MDDDVREREDSYLELLKRMKSRLETAVFNEGTSPRDLAALTKRLSDVAKEINEIEDRESEESERDAGGTADGEFKAEAV